MGQTGVVGTFAAISASDGAAIDRPRPGWSALTLVATPVAHRALPEAFRDGIGQQSDRNRTAIGQLPDDNSGHLRTFRGTADPDSLRSHSRRHRLPTARTEQPAAMVPAPFFAAGTDSHDRMDLAAQTYLPKVNEALTRLP